MSKIIRIFILLIGWKDRSVAPAF